MSASEAPSQGLDPSSKVFLPKAIVLGFHGTIAPIDWEDNRIVPYIRQHLKEYLTKMWNNDSVSRTIPNLRQESFDQHFVYENSECPVIANDDRELNEQIESVNDFLIWQMDRRKETRESNIVFRLVWEDGIDDRHFQVPLFADVVPALKSFKKTFQLKIALFSTVEEQLCRRLFANTTEGDINQYFDKYFDKTTGNSKDIESFKKIAKELKVETKDILYVIDYGQSAKCAKELDIQCLLIVRPMNRKIREYYSLRFNKINSLADIEFVRRQQNI